MSRMKLLVFLVAGLALTACYDEDLDGKQLNELTGDEVQDACDEFRDLFTFSKQDACEIFGVTLSVLGDNDCATTRDQCMSLPGEPQSNDHCAPSGMANCSVTVAEAKSCFSAQVRSLKALTCESSIADLVAIPPECQVLAEKCPEVLLGDGR